MMESEVLIDDKRTDSLNLEKTLPSRIDSNTEVVGFLFGSRKRNGIVVAYPPHGEDQPTNEPLFFFHARTLADHLEGKNKGVPLLRQRKRI